MERTLVKYADPAAGSTTTAGLYKGALALECWWEHEVTPALVTDRLPNDGHRCGIVIWFLLIINKRLPAERLNCVYIDI